MWLWMCVRGRERRKVDGMMKRWEWSLWMHSALSYKKPLPQQHGIVACDIKKVHVCYWSNKNVTNCTENKWRHTELFKTLKTTSLQSPSQPFPLCTSSSYHSSSAAAKQDPLGPGMPGKLPAEDTLSLKRCSQTHLSLLRQVVSLSLT